MPFIKTEKLFHPSVNHFSYQLVHLKSMHILKAISSDFIFTIWPSTATPLFQAGQDQTAHLLQYLALLHQYSCILKYNPLGKPLFDGIMMVRIYQQSGQWDSYIWAIAPLFLSYSSTSLMTSSFHTTDLPMTFFFFLLILSALPWIKNSKQNMWQTIGHFEMYERLTFFIVTFTTASSTCNDLAPIMLASPRLGPQKENHSRPHVFSHSWKNSGGSAWRIDYRDF